MGCPSCASVRITQDKYTTGIGWGLLTIGLLMSIPTLGGSLLLCLLALFCTERRGKCRDCKWKWVC